MRRATLRKPPLWSDECWDDDHELCPERECMCACHEQETP